jgi:catechol 2,3-dioxygenase-like lactoylglutathione lyase family enzyme
MIRGIHHTAISTRDLQRSLGFYRDLLGFEQIFTSEWECGSEAADKITGLKDSSAKVVMLKAGNACVELFEYSSPPPRPGDANRPACDHGITHLCLDVRDIQAEYERLRAAGMVFHCAPQTMAGVSATYGRDPDGNIVELLEVRDTRNPIALNGLTAGR